jgi:hypothetical protein
MLGKDARRVRTAGTMWEMDAANLDVAAATVQPTGLREDAKSTAFENGSTNRRWEERKSIPRIGFDTAARINETMKVWRPKVSFLVTLPHAEIGLPSAPDKSGPEVAAADL